MNNKDSKDVTVLVASDSQTGSMCGKKTVTGMTDDEIKATEEAMLDDFVKTWRPEEIKRFVRRSITFTVTKGKTAVEAMFPHRPITKN